MVGGEPTAARFEISDAEYAAYLVFQQDKADAEVATFVRDLDIATELDVRNENQPLTRHELEARLANVEEEERQALLRLLVAGYNKLLQGVSAPVLAARHGNVVAYATEYVRQFRLTH